MIFGVYRLPRWRHTLLHRYYFSVFFFKITFCFDCQINKQFRNNLLHTIFQICSVLHRTALYSIVLLTLCSLGFSSLILRRSESVGCSLLSLSERRKWEWMTESDHLRMLVVQEFFYWEPRSGCMSTELSAEIKNIASF